MLPSPRPTAQMNWLELTLKIVLTVGIGWLLINNLIAFRKLQESNPTRFKPAEDALKANKLDAARADLDRYLNANQKSVSAYIQVIGFCMRNKRQDLLNEYGARAQQDTKIAPAEERVSLLTTLGQAELDAPKPMPAQALAAAQQAMQLLPDSIEAQNSLAYTLAETSTDPAKLNQARDLIVRALTALNSQVGGAEHQLLLGMDEDTYGWVLYKQGLYGPKKDAPANYAHAVDVLMQALTDLPDEFPDAERKEIYYHLGAAYHKIGRIDDARNALETVLHYDPDNAAAKREYSELTPSPAAPSASGPPPAAGATQARANPAAVRAFTPLQTSRPGAGSGKSGKL